MGIQGVLASLIVIYAARTLIRSFFNDKTASAIAWVIRSILLILFFGYLSNFISHDAAKRETAQWLCNVIGESQLSENKIESEYLKYIAEGYATYRPDVLKGNSQKCIEMISNSETGPDYFTGPFLILVTYNIPRTYDSGTYSHCLVLNFYGSVKILDHSNNFLFYNLIPYLWPY